MYCFEFKKLTVETYNKIFLWENHSEMHILERWRQKWTKIYWLVLMFNHFLWSLIRLSHIRNLIIKSHQILSGSKIPIVPSKTPMKNVNRRKTSTSRNNESDCSSVSPNFHSIWWRYCSQNNHENSWIEIHYLKQFKAQGKFSEHRLLIDSYRNYVEITHSSWNCYRIKNMNVRFNYNYSNVICPLAYCSQEFIPLKCISISNFLVCISFFTFLFLYEECNGIGLRIRKKHTFIIDPTVRKYLFIQSVVKKKEHFSAVLLLLNLSKIKNRENSVCHEKILSRCQFQLSNYTMACFSEMMHNQKVSEYTDDTKRKCRTSCNSHESGCQI